MTTKKQHTWIDREHDRISTELACQAGPVGGGRKSATIVNLSAGGLKFACSRETFNLLLPEDQRIPGQISNVDLDILFPLHNAGRKKTLTVRTRVRVVHTERLAQDRYTVGVRFVDLRAADARAIEAYLREVRARPGWL